MNKLLSSWVILSIAFLSATSGFTADSASVSVKDDNENYDRLDRMGASGKKVDVIEWEGNLEVHVYPAGSLKGLGLVLDKKNKDKPVMVISYRFDNTPKPLIRRAILGIDLKEGFKAFRDPSADGYDKIIISNNGLSSEMLAFRLDPAPTQLYPDGHPALAKATDEEKDRAPAANKKKKDLDPPPPSDAEAEDDGDAKQGAANDEGRVTPFFMEHTSHDKSKGR